MAKKKGGLRKFFINFFVALAIVGFVILIASLAHGEDANGTYNCGIATKAFFNEKNERGNSIEFQCVDDAKGRITLRNGSGQIISSAYFDGEDYDKAKEIMKNFKEILENHRVFNKTIWPQIAQSCIWIPNRLTFSLIIIDPNSKNAAVVAGINSSCKLPESLSKLNELLEYLKIKYLTGI